jgi:hypothetical protein
VAELSIERDALVGEAGQRAQELQALQAQAEELRRERDAALEGGRRARSDLDAVLDNSSKMLKQVRGARGLPPGALRAACGVPPAAGCPLAAPRRR